MIHFYAMQSINYKSLFTVNKNAKDCSYSLSVELYINSNVNGLDVRVGPIPITASHFNNKHIAGAVAYVVAEYMMIGGNPRRWETKVDTSARKRNVLTEALFIADRKHRKYFETHRPADCELSPDEVMTLYKKYYAPRHDTAILTTRRPKVTNISL